MVAATTTAPVTGEVAAATAEQPAVPIPPRRRIRGGHLPAAPPSADGELRAGEPAQAADARRRADDAGRSGPAGPGHRRERGPVADRRRSPPASPNTPAPAPTAAPTPTAAAAAAAAQPNAEAPAEVAPSAQPVSPTPTSAPVATTANGRPNVERAVPLSRAVPTTGVLIQLASERGVTHARLNLKPVELGGIEVKLQSTPTGIHAQLVADSPEAARMLAQAGDDLRRQLEERDVNLLSLDVSTSSDQRNDRPGFSADGFGDDYRPGGYPSSYRGSREDTVLMEHRQLPTRFLSSLTASMSTSSPDPPIGPSFQ